jgi:amidase
MSAVADIAARGALEQAALVRAGELTCAELTELHLRRIELIDSAISSYVVVGAEQALAAARALDAGGSPRGVLHGTTVSIKDITDVAGLPTTFGTRAVAHAPATEDAAVVRRLRDAGCVVLGKTSIPEFGLLPVTESALLGACRNPWDPARSPGGSSGGAGAALAAGLCSVAHGNDGGGSIRIPAAWCGLVGIKPSRGRVSWAPRFGEMLSGLSTPGPLGRTVADAAAMLDVLSGYETGDPYWLSDEPQTFLTSAQRDPPRLRIALTNDPPGHQQVASECRDAAETIARLLSEAGHNVDEGTPAWHDDRAHETFAILARGLTAHFGRVDEEALEPITRAVVRAGRETTILDHYEALILAHRLARRVVAFWADHDVLITPTTGQPAPPIGWVFETGDPAAQFARIGELSPFTAVVNVTGQPAISVPVTFDAGGVPLGVQLIGRPAAESTLVSLAAEIERMSDWRPALAIDR